MMDQISIDETNRRILDILRNDARTSNAEIARQVGLTTSAVHERVRKLESKGIIRGYAAILAPEPLDLRLLAFVGVRISPHREARSVGQALSDISNVEEVFHLAGEECFLTKVRCRDTEELEELLLTINDIPSVNSTRTIICLRPVKEAPGPTVPDTITEQGVPS